jgi:hypothetical protein
MGYFHPANGRWYSSDRYDEPSYSPDTRTPEEKQLDMQKKLQYHGIVPFDPSIHTPEEIEQHERLQKIDEDYKKNCATIGLSWGIIIPILITIICLCCGVNPSSSEFWMWEMIGVVIGILGGLSFSPSCDSY